MPPDLLRLDRADVDPLLLEHDARDPATAVTGGDPVLTGRIARARLDEFPNHSTRLKRMGGEADRARADRDEAGR